MKLLLKLKGKVSSKMQKRLFQVEIPASKSMMNRALLVQSFFPDLSIVGHSNCDDVNNMKRAIASMIRKKDIDCGEAGTVLRFMGLRCSREKGTFKLLGKPGLMRRPHQEMVYILEQLGVECQLFSDHVVITSAGWKKPIVPLQIPRHTSSQFATGLLLSAWNLDFDLEFEKKSGVSESYWQMSLQIAQDLGMQIEKRKDVWKIYSKQKLNKAVIETEADYSSAFTVAVAAAISGKALITNAVQNSVQPDFAFIKIMKKMGIKIQHNGHHLTIEMPEEIKPIDMNLDQTPDLFPCLAVLCAFAKGESILRGAAHLAYKESNRIVKTSELLQQARIFSSQKDHSFHVVGVGLDPKNLTEFSFDPDHDHRMAFAAGLMKLKGYQIHIKNPQVVTKSYPEFWQVLGIKP